MPVGKRLRFEILKRDRFTCQYCGRTPPTVVLQVDHVHPASDGGSDDPSNLLTSCEDCNQGKSDVPLARVIVPAAEQAARLAEQREQLEEYNRLLMAEREVEARRIAEVGRYWFNAIGCERDAYTFGPGRTASLRTFIRSLTVAELFDAVDIALSRKSATVAYDEAAWKYFCGVCWTKIREAGRQ